jgi:RHS repeat-associated protein
VNYTYDGEGRRVQKSSGKLYWYGAGAEPLAESDLSGNISEEYIFFGGKRVARRVVSSGTVFYYLGDHLGTSRVIVQASQTTACYEADYLPYGKERVITDTCPQNYKFTGKERDAESGLDYFGARYYAWSLGRFLTPDEPFIDQHLGEPQSWNLYAYVRNNPLIYVDPTGQGLMTAHGGQGHMLAFARPGGLDNVMGAGWITVVQQQTVGGESSQTTTSADVSDECDGTLISENAQATTPQQPGTSAQATCTDCKQEDSDGTPVIQEGAIVTISVQTKGRLPKGKLTVSATLLGDRDGPIENAAMVVRFDENDPKAAPTHNQDGTRFQVRVASMMKKGKASYGYSGAGRLSLGLRMKGLSISAQLRVSIHSRGSGPSGGLRDFLVATPQAARIDIP